VLKINRPTETMVAKSKPNQGDNLQKLRHETSRTFRNKKREYLRSKINKFETNNKNKNIRDLYRGINEFKKGHQPRIILSTMGMVICSQIPTGF
jgi:hypothetical protein